MSSKWDAEFTQWLTEREVKFFRAAQRIAYDKQNAEDVFQEAMLDIYKRWSKVRNHPNLEGYAINVIFSKHVDLRRNGQGAKLKKSVLGNTPKLFSHQLITAMVGLKALLFKWRFVN